MFIDLSKIFERIGVGKFNFVIRNNTDTQIRDNMFAGNIYIVNSVSSLPVHYDISKKYRDLYEKERVVHSIADRLVILNEKYEILFNLFSREVTKPQIRFRGMYSGISTHRGQYEYSDVSVLEKEEQKSLKKLVMSGFPVKMILSLNIKDVLEFGFSVEDIVIRMNNMCELCSDLHEYANYQFVIDEEKSLDSTMSLDDKVMMYQYDFKNAESYKRSFWTSNHSKILRFNSEFDAQFNKLYLLYLDMSRILHIRDYCDYIRLVIQRRIENYNRLYDESD